MNAKEISDATLPAVTPADDDLMLIYDTSEGTTGKATIADIAPKVAENIDFDSRPTSGSSKAVTSNGLYDLLINTVGLLNTSDLQFPKPYLGNDINNYIYPGVYQIGGPEDYGIVLVLGCNINLLLSGNTWIWQVYFGSSGNVYVRKSINPSQLPPSSSEWSEWKLVKFI